MSAGEGVSWFSAPNASKCLTSAGTKAVSATVRNNVSNSSAGEVVLEVLDLYDQGEDLLKYRVTPKALRVTQWMGAEM
jgi:hypothetical protein